MTVVGSAHTVLIFDVVVLPVWPGAPDSTSFQPAPAQQPVLSVGEIVGEVVGEVVGEIKGEIVGDAVGEIVDASHVVAETISQSIIGGSLVAVL